MTRSEDEILGRELGKLAAIGTKIGTRLGGGHSLGPVTDKLAEAMGMRLASHYLPTERSQTKVDCSGDAAAVLQRVCGFFSRHGRIASADEAGESPLPKVSGVIGSGLFNMNPALLHAEVVASEAGITRVLITGAAKEGLIKQHTGEKAVRRLADYLQQPG